MRQPQQATHIEDGLFFKIGIHGKLFFWAFDEWRLSSRRPSEIEKMRKVPQPGEIYDCDSDYFRELFQSE